MQDRTVWETANVGNEPADDSQTKGRGAINAALRRQPSRRNPFPEEHFFVVPIALYGSGLARQMRPSQFKRYMTLLRLANYYYGATEITTDMQSLKELDGISTRSARDAHIKLQEYGLIRVAKTNPFTYTLISPAYWEENFGRIKPTFKRGRSIKVESEWPKE